MEEKVLILCSFLPRIEMQQTGIFESKFKDIVHMYLDGYLNKLVAQRHIKIRHQMQQYNESRPISNEFLETLMMHVLQVLCLNWVSRLLTGDSRLLYTQSIMFHKLSKDIELNGNLSFIEINSVYHYRLNIHNIQLVSET